MKDNESPFATDVTNGAHNNWQGFVVEVETVIQFGERNVSNLKYTTAERFEWAVRADENAVRASE